MMFSDKPIKEVVEEIELNPRNSTALLDAMGKTINSVERRWTETDEEERAEKVLFIVITDGGENSSKEFSKPKVFEMIETVKRDHGWEFTFVGANQDAILEANQFGIDATQAINYSETSETVEAVYRSAARVAKRYRTGNEISFLESERQESYVN